MARRATAWFRLLLRFAMDSVIAQRGRSALTILGMAIGTASVVGVVSIGLLGREYIVHLIEGVGSNLVFAYGTGHGVNPEEVDFGDVPMFERRVSGLNAIAPVLRGSELISIRGETRQVTLLGVTPAYEQVRNMVVESGRFFSPHEEAQGEKVCVISQELALELLGTKQLGEAWLRIFGLRFRIVGVYREGVESAAAVQKSEAAGLAALIPFSTFRNLSDIHHIDVVYFQAASPETVPEVVAGVSDVLAARHRNLSNFKVESLDQYLVLAQRVSHAVTVGLIAIAAVSLLVGGIGIMNIMLVTVTERTSDIGIRLALGAGQLAIMVQFLLEASILSLVGGVLGVVLGAGVPVYVGLLYGVAVPVSLTSVVVAFTVSVGVGLFFGFYPARKAANMNIVDALGYT
jgi:putative ABC transport system permease protein